MKYHLLLALLLSTIVNAVEVKQGDYSDRADVAAFIEQMASRSDYSEQELVEIFSTVIKQDHLFDLLNRPAEKELQWYQYRPIFIKQKRIDLGVKFWRQHQQLLSEVSAKTGVPEQIIIANIGVETFYVI